MKRALLGWVISSAAVLAIGCGKEDPGTSVRITLAYDSAIGLDTVDITAGADTVNAPISPELLLLLPDDAADSDMPIEVWARADGKRAAYGTTTVTPVRGTTVKAALSLTTCSPGCGANDTLTTCTGPSVTCALGCSSDGDAHCVLPKLSNGIDPTLADHARDIDLAEDTLFDVDTGEIIGGVERGKGEGTLAGITYAQMPAPAGGVPLAVFAFRNLTLQPNATILFTGARAVVFLVGESATIEGTINLAAIKQEPGAGGGAGGTSTTVAATGCGPGGAGQPSSLSNGNGNGDGGGGGGGGGTAGGAGGTGEDQVGDTGMGGIAGVQCLSPTLAPLRGGSGGGIGSKTGPGEAPAPGGGGGGALQLTAMNTLDVTGVIHAGGGGGGGGEPVGANGGGAGAGGGGGAGGAILLEAPQIAISSVAILAANGGGGGGGGKSSTRGDPGSDASASATPAAGGDGFSASNSGGAGGARNAAPVSVGFSKDSNGGGGGGGTGTIVLRGRVRRIAGILSPLPIELDIDAR